MAYWFKKYPEHLAAEVQALGNDSHYKQIHLERGKVLLSHGNIIVRLNQIHKFPFLILYPENTPYGLPVFFPLKRAFTKDEITVLSELTVLEVFIKVNPDIHFRYNLRHQNSAGNLCILEWDNLDEGVEFYGIPTLLKRVHDWCKGTITGEFPPDSQEVEFISHFNNIDYSTNLIYTDIFLNPELEQGEAYAKTFSTLPKGDVIQKETITYYNTLFLGISSAGFLLPTKYEFPKIFQDEGISNIVELTDKRGKVDYLIQQQGFIKIFWFHINTGPSPFENLTDLIRLVGNGDYENGVQRLSLVAHDELKRKPDSFFIALRFPNRKGEFEFQLFKIFKTGISAGLIGASKEDTLKQIVSDYTIVNAIRSTEITDKSYHQRNEGRVNREVLRKKWVNIIGVGALGSEIADIINKAGIGFISLIDNQTMKIHNSVRHLVGNNYMGALKVEAVKDIMALHNLYTNISPLNLDINSEKALDCIPDDSISISSIADDNTEGYLNQRAVEFNKTIYYSRALRGGKAARIFRVIPGKDACFYCHKLYREEGNLFINVPQDDTLPTLKNECNNPIRPASAADLKLISSLTARIVLDDLQTGAGDTNHWIWSTEELENLPAFQVTRQSIPPHSNCIYCNRSNPIEVNLDKNVLTFMQNLVKERPGIETGGVLAGYKDEQGSLNVTHASGPGPNATRSPVQFAKDIPFTQQFLDTLFAGSRGKTKYIGEWHSHPSRDNRPSSSDIKSLTEISYQKDYLTDMPVMIILSTKGDPSATIHPVGKLFYYACLSNNDLESDVLSMPQFLPAQKK
jgi:integrative and conjugative element protein (TIGR02256 family)